MAFIRWVLRSPMGWFVVSSGVFVLGVWVLARALADVSGWMALVVWFAYLVAFGIVGMRLSHRIGVRDP